MSSAFIWLSIAASLVMGLGGACFFIYAVKTGLFRDIEEAKFQMFWSDLEKMVDEPEPQEKHDRGPHVK